MNIQDLKTHHLNGWLHGYFDIDNDVYHNRENPGISKSALDQFKKSPAHYKEWLKQESVKTSAMTFGDALHCAVLEPVRFEASFAKAPSGDKRLKEVKDKWAQFEADNVGKTPLKEEEYNSILEMRDAIRMHPVSSELLSSGIAERAMYWNDVDTGVLCRGKFDFMTSSNVLVDIKTTESAQEGPFLKSVLNYGYHMQAAMYLDGVSTIDKTQCVDFIIVAIEKQPPYGIKCYLIDSDMIEFGRQEYKKLLVKYSECLKTNKWPCYEENISRLLLPAWAKIPTQFGAE